MEEGVVNSLLNGPLRDLYDHTYLVTDNSGSGNNWAVGNCVYGRKHASNLIELIRKTAEGCDCLQCFFMLHSLGGGTGSGLGSYILQLIRDEYSEVHRITASILPSLTNDEDDVVTSPYNTLLGLQSLSDLADCILPIDNTALEANCQLVADRCGSDSSSHREKGFKGRGAFNKMNNIVASMLLNLTSSSRFEGTSNVDLNEISMNLVPYPRLNFLIAAQSPNCTIKPKMLNCNEMPPYQQLRLHSLTCRLQQRLTFVPWNRQGWKVGHCLVPMLNHQYNILALSNNTAIRLHFTKLLTKFDRLYKRKAYLHHYTSVQGFDSGLFQSSASSLVDLGEAYSAFEEQARKSELPQMPRLTIAS